jgi:hypothetical protein
VLEEMGYGPILVYYWIRLACSLPSLFLNNGWGNDSKQLGKIDQQSDPRNITKERE